MSVQFDSITRNEAFPTPPADDTGRPEYYIDDFEEARATRPDAPIAEFLPPPEHPLRKLVLRELICIDLEHAWAQQTPRTLEDYRSAYPEVFLDQADIQELAFEEYRQRLLAGETPSPEEYARRYGAQTADWPLSVDSWMRSHHAGTQALTNIQPEQLELAARLYRRQPSWERADAGKAGWGRAASAVCTEMFRKLQAERPAEADRIAEALTSMPSVGDRLGNFELLAELGRGAFGRVFLARQLDMAGRCVALKVSADFQSETRALAQLLHNNVMPIYSCERVGPFAAICMPYLGSTTLADVLRELQGRGDLPNSGKGLISTLRDMGTAGSRSQRDDADSEVSEGDAAPPEAVVSKTTSRFTLDLLEKYSYVDAVLWIGARLADGLAHAHEHGIQHRDLKPANILLSDEGQPILLDFNLAEDIKLTGMAAARVGGTLPYMSPEQLRAMNRENVVVDARSDLFSLGVILYELLTGMHPYPRSRGRSRQVLAQLVKEREQPPTPLRKLNPDVSPAAEAVILKCLAGNPLLRYQSARTLQEDLQRQLAHLPLLHTPEPSWRERMHKWARRHPRLTSVTSIGILAVLLVLGLGAALAVTLEEVHKSNALEALARFHKEAAEVQLDFSSHADDPVHLRRIVDRGNAALSRFDFSNKQDWSEVSGYRYLPEEQRNTLRQQTGALLVAMSRAAARDAQREDGVDRTARLEEARHWIVLAATAFTPEEPPRTVLRHRAEIEKALCRPDAATMLLEEFKRRNDLSSLDQLLDAQELVVRGRYRAALKPLQELAAAEPLNLQAAFLLARCYEECGQDQHAALVYGTCLVLQPNSHRLHFNRGLAYFRMGDHQAAERDFSRAIELDGTKADAFFNRGLSQHALGKHREAVDDFSQALELGAPYSRVYFMRARAHEKLGNLEAARQDRAEGLRQVPTDARSWVARGLTMLANAPEKALEDFEQALRLQPRNRSALENKAHVLAERLGKTEAAIAALDQLVEEYPDLVSARASRGVLHARLGRRAKAHEDGQEALLLNSDPPTQYQVAGIYALTSKAEPQDLTRAFQLLSFALRRGYGLELLDKDPDLDPVRERPEFARLVEAAKTLRTQPPKSPKETSPMP